MGGLPAAGFHGRFLPYAPDAVAARRLRKAACCFVAGLALSAAAQGPARSPAAAEIDRLASSTWIDRTVSLADLGFRTPEVFAGVDARREYYLPIPPSVPIANATLKVESSYIRGDGGKTALLVSVDGHGIASRPADKDAGEIGMQLGLDGSSRPHASLRLGMHWYSVVPTTFCAEPRADANVLRLSPGTRLDYRFNGAAVQSLTVALGALSPRPAVLVAGEKLDPASFHAATQVGIALEQSSKRTSFVALPAVGAELDLSTFTVPAPLRAIPAYAALHGKTRVRLQSPQELAAYLTLADKAGAAEVVIADAVLLQRITAAFDALAGEVQALGGDAPGAFATFRQGAWSATLEEKHPGALRLATMGGRPVVLVAPQEASHAAALIGHALRGAVLSRNVGIEKFEASPATKWPLVEPVGPAATFPVLAIGAWTASFPIGKVSQDGQLPTDIVVDVAAAPSAAGTRPIASVFLNDILLGARQLDATGHPERIQAKIPRYALGSDNTVRIAVQRQPASDQCRETPQAFPVTVLPTSHLVLAKASPLKDFAGLAARFSIRSQIAYPQAYAGTSLDSLPRLVRLAAAVGVSPQKTRLTGVGDGAGFNADASFLLVDLPLPGVDQRPGPAAGQLELTDAGGARIDLRQLDHIGIFRVVEASGHAGVAYQAIGTHTGIPQEPFRLSRGDTALVGVAGVLQTSATPALYEPATTGWLGGLGTLTKWVVGAVFATVLLLLLGAWWINRRKRPGLP